MPLSFSDVTLHSQRGKRPGRLGAGPWIDGRQEQAVGLACNRSQPIGLLTRMINLGVYPRYHEAAACVFDDDPMISVLSLECPIWRETDGGRMPDEVIDAFLAIA